MSSFETKTICISGCGFLPTRSCELSAKEKFKRSKKYRPTGEEDVVTGEDMKSLSPVNAEPPRTFRSFAAWCEHSAQFLTRISLGLIFIWFGGLKLAGVSPATELVSQTFFFIPAAIIVPLIGGIEGVIGLCLFFRRTLGFALCLLAPHLLGTFLSFIIVPQRCFVRFPFVLTTEGEFIMKNLVIISAALFLVGSLRKTDLTLPSF